MRVIRVYEQANQMDYPLDDFGWYTKDGNLVLVHRESRDKDVYYSSSGWRKMIRVEVSDDGQ